MDARASPVLEARHKPGAWLEGRSTLTIVEETQEDDDQEGLQEQRHTNWGSRTRRQSDKQDDLAEADQQFSENLARLESIWARIQAGPPSTPSRGLTSDVMLADEPLPLAEARQQQTTGTKQRPAPHLVAHLQVDSLSSEDNGFYKCRVDFRRSRSRVNELELKIIGE